MTKILECSNLVKIIKKEEIIKNVSFSISEGEILGFIGPNGAGKTTIIKMILGLTKITGGTVLINNNSITKNYKKAIQEVGAIIEEPDTYMYLTGFQNLLLASRLYNVSIDKLNEIVKLVGLEKSIHNKVTTYSLGMRGRLGIALALVPDPKLLILDEPFNGLDPQGVKDIRNLLLNLAQTQKKAILISSHILSELETFCTNICLIKNGKLLYNTSLKEAFNNNYLIKVDDSRNLTNYNLNILNQNTILVKNNTNLNQVLKILLDNNIKIYEISKETSSLEQLFFERTGISND